MKSHIDSKKFGSLTSNIVNQDTSGLQKHTRAGFDAQDVVMNETKRYYNLENTSLLTHLLDGLITKCLSQ